MAKKKLMPSDEIRSELEKLQREKDSIVRKINEMRHMYDEVRKGEMKTSSDLLQDACDGAALDIFINEEDDWDAESDYIRVAYTLNNYHNKFNDDECERLHDAMCNEAGHLEYDGDCVYCNTLDLTMDNIEDITRYINFAKRYNMEIKVDGLDGMINKMQGALGVLNHVNAIIA